MKKIIKNVKMFLKDMKIFLRNIPSPVAIIFVVAVIVMNLLANKSINLNLSFLALDTGIIVSWIIFLVLDIVTKHFGPKEATMLSIFASVCNVGVALIFFVGSSISGSWGESFDSLYPNVVNGALDNTFKGTWYVLFGSTIAFISSAVVNNLSNYSIGKLFKKNPDSVKAYCVRTYLSTMIGQFVDNFVFSLIVSHFFFGWTLVQCIMCSVTGMVVELICEIVFSPIGYKISKKWKQNHIGDNYFEYLSTKKI